MGEPMALRLAKAGTPLLVWSRSASKCGTLAEAGAAVAKDPAEVFTRCPVVFLMLVDGAAIDAVLARGERAFSERVKERTLVSMVTTAPGYSGSRPTKSIGTAPVRPIWQSPNLKVHRILFTFVHSRWNELPRAA
jgi:hypothetical protein